ncbi:Copia protein [Fusarium oxysporum f. sp. raphani]|uniref:Copia protein n=1 Tax=Fusarium oxysporum f. sp. raphani TaxID=96318 RepID=A0A8J5PJ87_FUSOX|nr:Copia protein [Fusarium oxysporum f. sp. raphani]
MVHGRKPNLSNLKIIGSLAYVLIKNKKARPAKAKLQENALMGWLVGLDATNIYKVWVPHLERIIVSRDVQVDEKVMYNPQLATTLPESGQTLAITINEVDLDEENIEPLSIMENTATSVPVSIQPEAELSRPGLLLTPQISPERSIAGEIQVAPPVDEPPTLPRPTNDLLIIAQPEYLQQVNNFKAAVHSKYEIKDLGEAISFLNIRILRDVNAKKLWICQDGYINKLGVKFGIDQPMRTATPLTSSYRPQSFEGQATIQQITEMQEKLSQHAMNPSPEHLRTMPSSSQAL